MMRWMIFAPLMVLTGLLYGQVPDYVPTDGLVAWYDFANDACDVAGLAGCFELIDGAYIGEVEGSDDLALRLDGNYAELAADSNFDLTEFTIAFRYFYDEGSQMRMWKGNPDYPDDVNYAIKSSEQTIFEQNFNYSLDCGSILDNSPNGFSANAFESPGAWLNVVVTRSSAGIVSLNTSNNSDVFTGTPTICNETQPIRIGHWWDGDPSPSFGWVDHLGFWSTVLTEIEITQLLNRELVSTGCTDSTACNYDAESSWDDGSCDYFTCLCLDGTIWNEELGGCVPANTCPQDLNYDGIVGTNDLLVLLSTFGLPCQPEVAEWTCGDPVTYHDYDYETVLIGEQCWFAENLRTEQYQNGDSIAYYLTDVDWGNTTTGAVAVYGEGDSNCNSYTPDFEACEEEWSLSEYGRLYNWHSVQDVRDLCPVGWHIPADWEWTEMTDFLGGATNAADQLKATSGWLGGENGTNTSGFNALPGGVRNVNGEFDVSGSWGNWWSSSLDGNGDSAWYRGIHCCYPYMQRNDAQFNAGISIRCVND